MKPCFCVTLLALFAAPPAAAQRSCNDITGLRLPNGQVVYATCAVDRPPTPYPLPPWPRHLLQGWDKDAGGWATVSIIYHIDTLGHALGLSAPYLRLTDTAFARRIFDQVRSWRFRQSLRGRSPVAVIDTLVIHPWLGARWEPPAHCFGCDTVATTTQWRVTSTTPAEIRCDTAIARFVRDSVTLWDDWIYETLPRCPHAVEVLVTHLRNHPPSQPGEGLGRHRATMIATLQGPALARELMRSARAGHRYAFRFLPIALGLGFERVTDTTAGRWDRARQIPAEGCGELKVYLTRPGTEGRRVDPRGIRDALALADSVVADPDTPDPVRSTAWCLATQLR